MYLSMITLIVGIFTEVIFCGKDDPDEGLSPSKVTARYVYYLLSLTYLFWLPFNALLKAPPRTSTSTSALYNIPWSWNLLYSYLCYLGALNLFLAYLWMNTMLYDADISTRTAGDDKVKGSRAKTIRAGRRNR